MPAAFFQWLGAAIGSTGLIAYAAEASALALKAFVVIGSTAFSHSQQRKARRAALAAYNDSLKDRLQTVRGALEARRLVMGKVRTGGALAFIGTTGTNKEKLSMVIALASHQIKAVDQVYFNDELLTLDGSGWATSGTYYKSRVESGSAAITLSGGSGSVVLPHAPTTATVTIDLGSDNGSESTAGSIGGSTVSVSGFGPHTGTGTVHYTYTTGTSMARVRWMLGSDSQTAFSDLVAAFPSEWTSNHRLRGVAYLVVDLTYDPDVYPSGIPNVSAVIRGTDQVYDTRSLLTGYSENPALLMRWYALHAMGGRRTSGQLDEATFIAAANACDASEDYGDGATAIYTAGTVASTEQAPAEVMDELAESMAGKWGFSGGVLRCRAGSMGATVASINADWLAGGVSIQPRRPRAQLANIMSGTFTDSANEYRLLQFTRVEDAPAVAEDGAELVRDVEFSAITRSGQAQQVAAVILRDERQALTVSMTCNMRAYPLQVFDVVSVTLDRFGWSAKTFEVMERGYSHGGGISLVLKEIDSSIFTFGTSFPTVDPAPNTALPSAHVVPTIGTLNVTSTSAELLDGSIVSRAAVTWPAVADEGVTLGGFVEVAHVDASQNAGFSVSRASSLTGQTFVGLRRDVHYLFKARAVNGAGVRGGWSAVTMHQVNGPVVTLAGLGYTGDTNATNGATWGANISGQPADINVLNSAVSLGLPMPAWLVKGSHGMVTVSDGKVGDQVFRIIGSAYSYPNQGNYIAVDYAKTYRVRFWARPSVTNTAGTLYFTLRQWLDEGVTAGPDNGGRDPYHPGITVGSHNAAYGAQAWHEYVWDWTSADWQTGVKYFLPEFLDNYTGAAGHWDIQGFSIVEVGDLTAALSTAQAAQATADGKIDSFWQTSAPGSASEGDIWFDTDDGHRQYRWTSGAWVVAADTRIGTAISNAATAQATADGKVVTFVTGSTPTATAVGDLWLNSAAGNALYRWSGSAWVAVPLGSGALAGGAATAIDFDGHDFAGGGFGTVTARNVYVTPAVDCTIEFTARIVAANVHPDSGNMVHWRVTPSGGSTTVLGAAYGPDLSKREYTAVSSFAATGGVQLDFDIRTTKSGPNVLLYDSQIRIVQIKR